MPTGGSSRAEVERHGVGEVERDVLERVDRVPQGRLEPSVDLDHVDVGRAGGEVLGEDAQAAADLEHDIPRADLAGPFDHAEDVRVDQEVLAELPPRTDVELVEAAQRRLAGAHHPKRSAAHRSTSRSKSA